MYSLDLWTGLFLFGIIVAVISSVYIVVKYAHFDKKNNVEDEMVFGTTRSMVQRNRDMSKEEVKRELDNGSRSDEIIQMALMYGLVASLDDIDRVNDELFNYDSRGTSETKSYGCGASETSYDPGSSSFENSGSYDSGSSSYDSSSSFDSSSF